MYNLGATTYVQPCSQNLCPTLHPEPMYNLKYTTYLQPMYNLESRTYVQPWIQNLCTILDPEPMHNLRPEPMLILKSRTHATLKLEPMYNI